MNMKAPTVDCWEEGPHRVHVDIRQTNSARDLRDALLLLAYMLNDMPDMSQAVCVLLNSRLSKERAFDELSKLRGLVHAELAARLHVLPFCRGGRAAKSDLEVPESFLRWLEERVGSGGNTTAFQSSTERRGGVSAKQAVVAALYEKAMGQSNNYVVRTRELQRAAGVSYPTVLAALKPLIEEGIVTYKRGIIDFSGLERSDHLILLRQHANSRMSRYFVDPTGLMRPSDLEDRLEALRYRDARFARVRVGGVVGASHHFPVLDITSAPRLDLEMANFEIDLIRTIDAGLEEQDGNSRFAVLAVHPSLNGDTRTRTELDQLSEVNASAYDCLVDLVELGYEREACEMANALLRQSASKT